MNALQTLTTAARSVDQALTTGAAPEAMLNIAREVARDEARLSPRAFRDQLTKRLVALSRVLDPKTTADVDHAQAWARAIPDDQVAATIVSVRLLEHAARKAPRETRSAIRDLFTRLAGRG